MTLANQLSLLRLALVPCFGYTAWRYGQSADMTWRYWTIGLFSLAAFTDAADGYIARHWNQKTALGAVLDPLADKCMMTMALLMLTFAGWPRALPWWCAGIVIARDVISSLLALVIKLRNGTVRVRPHWTGKVATIFQMTALLWVMLDIPWFSALWAAALATAFTLASSAVYLTDGIGQLRAPPHA